MLLWLFDLEDVMVHAHILLSFLDSMRKGVDLGEGIKRDSVAAICPKWIAKPDGVGEINKLPVILKYG